MLARFFAVFLLSTALAIPASADSPARDQHGETHAWKGSGHGLTVIDFAASWCAPCQKALPRLQTFAASKPGLRVLVVSVDDEEAGRDRLIEDLELTLPVLWDEGYAISEHYQPAAMPTTVIIDDRGAEIYRHGGSDEAGWRAFTAFVEERLR